VPAEEVGQGRPAAAIRNVGEFDVRHLLEQDGAEMDAAADAGRRV